MNSLSLKQKIGLDMFAAIVRDEARRHPLRQLFWECTLRCNLSCRHCGSDCRTGATQRDMPFEDFEKVLLRIKDVYDPHHISIVVSGGEPLMRDDIARCGRRMYDLEYPWGMVSNGRLMTEKKIDELLGAGMRSCTISLDGLEEDHNWLRGSAESFKCAVRAIERLAVEPDFGFDVVTCVNRRNLAALPELKELLISLGVKRWRLFTIFSAGRAAGGQDLKLESQEYRSLMDFIIATRKEGRIIANHACEGFLGPYEGKVRDNLFACHAGLSIAGVRIDGGISACTSIRPRFDQGNIYRDDFVDVWEHRFEMYRDRGWARKGECAACRYWKYCLGGGLHLRDAEGNLLHCNLKNLGI